MAQRARVVPACGSGRGRSYGLVRAIAATVFVGCSEVGETAEDPVPMATPLPAGEWVPAGNPGPDALLLRLADGRGRPAQRNEGGRETGAIWVGSDGAIRPARLDTLEIMLPAPASQAVAFGRVEVDEGSLLVSLPGGSPALTAVPSRRGMWSFEFANLIWTVDAEGAARTLTSDTVGPYSLDALTRLQREGEVILYWAAAPVWDPTGTHLAYVSNRRGVAASSGGQDVWVLDTRSGIERPLLAEGSHSFRALGWLGDELLYIADRPGVWAVHPLRGTRRQVVAGIFLDAARDGSAAATGTGAPDSIRIEIISGLGRLELPRPPMGSYLAEASFSPTNRFLLVQAADPAGTSRRYYVFDVVEERLDPIGWDGVGRMESARWATDERILLYARDGSGPPQAWLTAIPPARSGG